MDADPPVTAPAPVPRDVKVFGAASFFTDVAADMVRPLLPFFLKQVLHAGGVELGLIEGSADAAASLLKVVSGRWNDRLRGERNEARRKWLIIAGYAVAALARPLTALASSPLHVLATRVGDRIGKGIRTAPRDAWIADVTPLHARARAYGLHRALDNAGAFAGPLVALGLLQLAGLDLRTVIALSAAPAALAILTLLIGLRTSKDAAVATSERAPDAAQPETDGPWPSALKRFFVVATMLALASASQGFLLLRAGQAGVPTWAVLLVWTGHSGLTAVLNIPLATLSNRLGHKRAIVAGWIVLALVHTGFALASSLWAVIALFALYSIYFALTEGAERALLASLAPAAARGRAFGLYHGLIGGGTLAGNLAFGAVWDRVSPETAFAMAASIAAAASLGLWILVSAKPATGALNNT